MSQDCTPTAEVIGGSEPRPSACAANPRLIPAPTAAARCGMSVRAWLRLCDAGQAPWGVKLRHLRRWDVAELNDWIAAGCPAVASMKGGKP